MPCTVTEMRELTNEPAIVRLLSKPLSGVRNEQICTGMQVTLERLKAAAEAG